MPKRRADPEFEFRDHWLGRVPGTDSWYVFWHEPAVNGRRGKTRRRSLGEADRGEAADKLVQFVLTRKDGGQDPWLPALIERFCTEHAPRLRSEKHAVTYATYLAEHYGAIRVSALTKERQEEFLDWAGAKGWSVAYIQKIAKALRKSLQLSYEAKEIPGVPFVITGAETIAARLNLPEPEAAERDLSIAELAAIADALPEKGHGAANLFRFFILSLNTLARPEAVCQLTRFQCDIPRRRVVLNPAGRRQTHKRRPVVPMTDCLAGWLPQWPEDQLITAGKMKRQVKRLCDRAGLPDASQYWFRHSMAVLLRARGVQPWDTAGLLGHKFRDFRITEGYAKALPEHLTAAAKAIDNIMVEIQDHAKRRILPQKTVVALKLVSRKASRGQGDEP